MTYLMNLDLAQSGRLQKRVFVDESSQQNPAVLNQTGVAYVVVEAPGARRPIFRIAHAEQTSLVADGELLWSELFSAPA